MRDNKGFTLIELLIVVVIIGILAAIAIPKFSATREKAYISAMKSDLKNLATQEEIYYSDWFAYSTSLANLGFSQSDGVTVAAVSTTPGTGWGATAAHSGTTQTCAIFYGSEPAIAPATVAGAILCQ